MVLSKKEPFSNGRSGAGKKTYIEHPLDLFNICSKIFFLYIVPEKRNTAKNNIINGTSMATSIDTIRKNAPVPTIAMIDARIFMIVEIRRKRLKYARKRLHREYSDADLSLSFR